jgi:hypothetical protein
MNEAPEKRVGSPLLRLWRRLGPSLVTGAADDDPSGIATHSQIGAQFGFQLSWTFLFSLPLMVVIQEVAAEIGSVTGRGNSQANTLTGGAGADSLDGGDGNDIYIFGSGDVVSSESITDTGSSGDTAVFSRCRARIALSFRKRSGTRCCPRFVMRLASSSVSGVCFCRVAIEKRQSAV